MSTACLTSSQFPALLTPFKKSHSDQIWWPNPSESIMPPVLTCCVRIFCSGWTHSCHVHIRRPFWFSILAIPAKSKHALPIIPIPASACLCFQAALPRDKSSGVPLLFHFPFVCRIVYEAQIRSLMQVAVLGTQNRHPCVSQKARLRTWCSLPKPAGALIPAVQLQWIHFDKYFCGVSHLSTMHCHHSPDFTLTTHHGKDRAGGFPGKWKMCPLKCNLSNHSRYTFLPCHTQWTSLLVDPSKVILSSDYQGHRFVLCLPSPGPNGHIYDKPGSKCSLHVMLYEGGGLRPHPLGALSSLQSWDCSSPVRPVGHTACHRSCGCEAFRKCGMLGGQNISGQHSSGNKMVWEYLLNPDPQPSADDGMAYFLQFHWGSALKFPLVFKQRSHRTKTTI